MRCGNIIQDDWTANGIAVRLFAMIIVYYKLNRKAPKVMYSQLNLIGGIF